MVFSHHRVLVYLVLLVCAVSNCSTSEWFNYQDLEKLYTEQDGPCSKIHFRCASGTCVGYFLECDGFENCADGSDEEKCTRCGRNKYDCKDGSCVDSKRRCDGYNDCPDKSDEFECQEKCRGFLCENGQCIYESGRCDVSRNCEDGSDEKDCDPEDCKGEYTIHCNETRTCIHSIFDCEE